jgi:hypothetical protein
VQHDQEIAMPSARWRRPSELSSTPPTREQETQRWVDSHHRETEKTLMCAVSSIAVDHENHYAVIEVPRFNSPSGYGVLEIVSRLDPGVQMVDVYAGGQPDLRYKLVDGSWETFRITFKK